MAGEPAFRLRSLEAGDAPALARLRGSEVTDGLLATLGDGARQAFFAAALRDPDAFGAIAANSTGPVGYVLVAGNVRRIERRALRSSPGLLLAAIRSVIVHGGLRRWLGLVRAIVRPKPPTADPEPRLRLLDIVVSSQARGAGVGRALVKAGLDEAARRGHRTMGLSVVSSNEAAIRLYRATGFATSGHGIRRDGVAYQMMRATLPATS